VITIPELKLTLTDIMALWGALLSTVLAFWQIRRERRHVKVTCSRSFSTPDFTPMLSMTVINHGHRPITITTAYVILSNGNQLINFQGWGYMGRGALTGPLRLEDGESHTVLMPLDTIRLGLLQVLEETGSLVEPVRVSVTDASGKRHNARISRPLRNWLMSSE
jgi:hypothetical protein